MAGKALGTNGNDFTQLEFCYSAGATNAARYGIGVQSGTVWISGVQLEVGSVATPLEKLDPRYDQSNCNRFYTTGYANHQGYALTGNIVSHTVRLEPMRASPTVANDFTGSSNVGSGSMSVSGSTIVPAGVVAATGTFVLVTNFTASADL